VVERRGTPCRTFLSRAALVLALAGCTSAQPAPRVEAPPQSREPESRVEEVAFALAGPGGGALVVPVIINGHGPFDFALDTGATLTCIDLAVARRLGLAEERGASAVGAGMGGAGRIPLMRLDSLRVGGARAGEMMACALDLQHARAVGLGIDGLLGLNFLRAFRVTLDFERGVMLLQSPHAAP